MYIINSCIRNYIFVSCVMFFKQMSCIQTIKKLHYPINFTVEPISSPRNCWKWEWLERSVYGNPVGQFIGKIDSRGDARYQLCQKDIKYAGGGWRSLENIFSLTTWKKGKTNYFPFIYEKLLSIFLAKNVLYRNIHFFPKWLNHFFVVFMDHKLNQVLM